MNHCECLEGCPFFNDRMENMPSTANLFKMNYCKSEFQKCARYMIFKSLGKPAVPLDLFPNENERAEELLKASK